MTFNKLSHIQILGSLLLLCLPMSSFAFDTLFTSPQQRTAFDLQRSRGNVPSEAPTLSNYTQKQEKLFFNGYVTRKSGPSTVWANDKILENSSEKRTVQNGTSAKLNHIKGTSVPIKSSTLSKAVRLQPGQTLNLETGEIAESYSLTRPNPPANSIKKVTLSSDAQNTESEQLTEQLISEQTEDSKNGVPEKQ